MIRGEGLRDAPAGGLLAVPGYAVLGEIGAGGFGRVYRARHDLLRREVAIKVLHPERVSDPSAVARFVSEARAIGQLSHPNIVDVFDFGTLGDGRQYFVMELLHGRTLRDELQTKGALALNTALPILRGIADGVDAAHAAGIAHRDLKPDNVFLLEGGGIKVIDFGLAKLTAEDAPAVTQTGVVFGTPQYMSPEQCRGSRVGPATDAYSFGVLVYHTLTGSLPFSGDALALALAHLNEDPEPPSVRAPSLDLKVDRVVLALMAKDPAVRPQSLRKAVDALIGGAVLPRVKGRARRRIALGAVVASSLAAVGGGVLMFSTSDSDATCPLAAEKLSGVWDDSIRADLRAHWNAVKRPDIQRTWQRAEEDVANHMSIWEERWNASCSGGERTRDPLLWAQRQACLENVLPSVRSMLDVLRQANTATFVYDFWPDYVMTHIGGLDFCTDEKKLRETTRPLTDANRDRAARLREELRGLRDAWRDGLDPTRTETLKAGEPRMREIEAELRSIGVANFSEATWRGRRLSEHAGDDVRFVPLARSFIHEAIREAEAAFNDAILSDLYTILAELERDVSSSSEVVSAMIDKVAAAVGRTGIEPETHWLVRAQRATLAERDGDFERAFELLDLFQPVWTEPYAGIGYDMGRVNYLTKLGRYNEAEFYLERWVSIHLVKLGPYHLNTVGVHIARAFSLSTMGKHREAFAAIDEAEAVSKVIAFEDGRVAIARKELLARAGQPIDASVDEWKTIMTKALARGDFAVIDRGLAALDGRPKDDQLALLSLYAALRLGDLDEARRNHADVTATVAASRARQAIFAAGAGGASLLRDSVETFGEWRRELLHRRTYLLAEADAWLGTALVEQGRTKEALVPLQEARAILANLTDDGFHYFAPMVEFALARAVLATSGDRAGALALARRARAGFARLSGFWTRESDRLTAWLAAHET